MNQTEVMMVRIYLSEGEKLMKTLFGRLHDEEKVRGVTVFRGIAGFGRSGVVHSARLLDLAMDLPVIIEFYDEAEKVRRILDHLESQLPPGHVVTWLAQVNEG